jgi:hypothetical protein
MAVPMPSAVGPSSSNEEPSEGDGVDADIVEVVRGVPSRGRDRAVVALDINGEALCSGTLVGPRAVLTARHCVSRTVENIQCPSEEPHVLEDRSPASIRVLLGDELSSARLVAVGREIVVPVQRGLCGRDIAVVLLDTDVSDVDPMPLGDNPAAEGDRVRAVGFGKPTDGGAPGIKLVREHVPVLGANEEEFLVGEATCQGDSGGPALDETTGALVGIISRGGPRCRGPEAHNIYTQVFAFRSLIEDALRRDAEGFKGKTKGASERRPKGKRPSSDMGVGCTQGVECASGVCVQSEDLRYCSRVCGHGDRCPPGFRCKGSKRAVSDGAPAPSVCIKS